MKRIEGKRLLSLHNVQEYLSDIAPSLRHAIPAEMRMLLDECLAALKEAAGRQDAHARMAAGTVARQRLLRRALIRDHMALISTIATLRMEEEPALASLTTLGQRLPAEQLAAHARGMARIAERWTDLFIRDGCKPTFIQDLHEAADALLGALHERAMHLAEVHAATVAIGTDLARARKVVRVVDVFLRSELADAPDRLARWNLVKRVPRLPRRAVGSDSDQQDAAAVADSVAAAEVETAVEAVTVLEVGMLAETVTVVETVEADETGEVEEAVTAMDLGVAVEEVIAPSHVPSFVLRLVPAFFGSRLLPRHRVRGSH